MKYQEPIFAVEEWIGQRFCRITALNMKEVLYFFKLRGISLLVFVGETRSEVGFRHEVSIEEQDARFAICFIISEV